MVLLSAEDISAKKAISRKRRKLSPRENIEVYSNCNNVPELCKVLTAHCGGSFVVRTSPADVPYRIWRARPASALAPALAYSPPIWRRRDL